MSRPRFLADHDFREPILRGLSRLEPAIDIVRARDVGLDSVPDDAVLAYAAAEGLLLLSHDVKTMRAAALARVQAGHAMNGLLLAHQRAILRPIVDELLMIWATSEAEEWVDRVEFLPL
jgi:hypothetical protein